MPGVDFMSLDCQVNTTENHPLKVNVITWKTCYPRSQQRDTRILETGFSRLFSCNWNLFLYFFVMKSRRVLFVPPRRKRGEGVGVPIKSGV